MVVPFKLSFLHFFDLMMTFNMFAATQSVGGSYAVICFQLFAQTAGPEWFVLAELPALMSGSQIHFFAVKPDAGISLAITYPIKTLQDEDFATIRDRFRKIISLAT